MTNRLIHIVDLINISITDGFITKDVKAHGLVRLEPRQGQVIPQKYKGFGDAEFVFEDKNALVIYHRLTGTSKDKDDSQSFGTKSLITETYSLKMILFGNKRKLKDNTEDIDYEISEIVDTLIPNRLSTVTLNNINAKSGVISSTSIDNDKVAVFGGEFPDLSYKLKPENILSSIDYEIELTFDSDCKDISCPPGDALIDLTKISCVNLNDNKFGLTASQIEDCNLCSSATITDSDGVTTFEVASGGSGACSPCPAISVSTCQELNDGLTQTQRQVIQRVNLTKTGAVVSYGSNDDAAENKGRLVNFLTLDCNNSFGNTNRFTDSVGGQVYGAGNSSIADYMIDHATGIGWQFNTGFTSFPLVNWVTALANAAAHNNGTFSDFALPNIKELFSLTNFGTTRILQYAPLNISASLFLWSSNTSELDTLFAHIMLTNSAIIINLVNKTVSEHNIYARNHF